MKLVVKGKYTGPEQLSAADLPKNAVRYKEPETPTQLNLVASLFTLPAVIICLGALYLKFGRITFEDFFDMYNLWALLGAILIIVPHEMLHAICFPKNAVVELWYSLKNMMAFVHSVTPTPKGRFIFLSILPTLVFGIAPLIVWLIIPTTNMALSSFLFSFAALNLLLGVGDYLNIYNTLRQVPNGAMTVLSEFHSYWYLPGSDNTPS